MKNYKLKVILIILLIITAISIFPRAVKADMGQKPSITITIKNLSTNNYLIDLLVYDETGENYYSEMSYNGEGLSDKQVKQLYDINYDGWISESTRWIPYLLFPDCMGNNKKTHVFSYFGTPTKYKIIIINNDTGEIKVSNEITRTNFSSFVSVDYNNIKRTKEFKSFDKNIIIALILTIIFEIIIGLLMKLKKYTGLIAITNLVTNSILQILLYIIHGNFIIKLLILEIFVFIVEFLIYKKYIKEESKKKLLVYVLIANMITLGLTFIII